DEQARRPRPVDDVQRGRDDRRRLHGRRRRDLHVLERRLSRLVPACAHRLLPPAPRPAEPPPPVPASGMDEVRRARLGRVLRDHLLLRRPCVRILSVLARWEEHTHLLPHRPWYVAPVPAASLL